MEKIVKQLHAQGWSFLRKWQPELNTEECATCIGKIFDIEKRLSEIKIGNVQTLIPKKRSKSLRNQYSGVYGLSEFPIHTDLAHWEVPPRYILLRCVKGNPRVYTRIVNYKIIANIVGRDILRQALVVPRRKHHRHIVTVLPVEFRINCEIGIRWDFLFLNPVNMYAKQLSDELSRAKNHIGINVSLSDPGDTLIIDNWKVLHGRSSVPSDALSRKIERVYLENLYYECE